MGAGPLNVGMVGAALRGRAMAGHNVGSGGARRLAAGTWAELLDGVARSNYGTGLATAPDRAELRRHCSEVVVWNLRVLAGWCPTAALPMLRALAGDFEIENIESHLRSLAELRPNAAPPAPTLDLGALGVTWARVEQCATADEVRDCLHFSTWGDPGGTDLATVAAGLRIAWARRVRRLVPGCAPWAGAAAALLVASQRFVFQRELSAATATEVDRLIGRRWRVAATLDEYVAGLGDEASWVFAGLSSPSELWRAEAAWWQRVGTDAAVMLRGARPSTHTLVGAAASMLVDRRRVHAAIETAERGPIALEVFDAVA